MKIVTTIAELRAHHDEVRRAGGSIGLVPTMGWFHEGHLSLMGRARAAHDHVTTTLFVNPLQFAPTEDLATYPRDLDRDAALAAEEGVDVLFAPSVEEMYPAGASLTTVQVGELSAPFEGASRPTHFTGVATVVTKLFSIAGPCTAYFGEKDYQQLLVVARMAADLNLPVEVVGCPTVREHDGLAMSSRNVKLEPAERAAAPTLHRALCAGAARIAAGERDPDVVIDEMRTVLAASDLVETDYADVVDAATLVRPTELRGELRLLVAARLGEPRLIDNLGIHAPA
ncbi:MAG: pantoate--beta-alanine ligase [Actinomycetota bacterium]|nr:pantoate--beta-alanine ligase [Actinomycetota bacterium]